MLRLLSKPLSLVVLSGVVAAGPIWWHFYRPNPIAAAAHITSIDGESQPNADLAVDLIRAGLDTKSLAAAGLSANAATSLAGATNTYLANNPSALTAADAAYGAARRETDRLKRLIESGKGSQEDVASYQTQSAALASATSQRQAALDAIFNAATANLTDGQKGTLATIRANRALSDAPTEFLTVNRTQQEWVQLRDDLANERIAVEYPDTLDSNAQSRLATCRAVSAVATAKAALDANLAAVTSAIASATSDH